jgi:hypothetical protein
MHACFQEHGRTKSELAQRDQEAAANLKLLGKVTDFKVS